VTEPTPGDSRGPVGRATALAAVAVALAILVAVVVVGFGNEHQSDKTPANPTTTSVSRVLTAPPTPTATEVPKPLRRRIRLADLVGQKIMVGFRGLATPPSALLRDIQDGHVGGVILFSENTGGALGTRAMIKRLQRAAKAGGHPRLLIATDQEGGDVKRIPNAPPTLSPTQMGQAGATTSRAQGLATGKALHSLGINMNLAPVTDVPYSPQSFLGTRTFGTTTATVAANATAFASGVQRAGVAATAKHYPGLGTTGANNTDTSVVAIHTSLGELTARARPFHALARDGVRAVMVSSATYAALDPARPAVLSKAVVRKHLRRFFPDGVVISDAFETPAITAYGRRAPVLATNAGVDVLLYTPTDAQGAFASMVAAYQRGEIRVGTLRRSYARIQMLKQWIGERERES